MANESEQDVVKEVSKKIDAQLERLRYFDEDQLDAASNAMEWQWGKLFALAQAFGRVNVSPIALGMQRFSCLTTHRKWGMSQIWLTRLHCEANIIPHWPESRPQVEDIMKRLPDIFVEFERNLQCLADELKKITAESKKNVAEFSKTSRLSIRTVLQCLRIPNVPPEEEDVIRDEQFEMNAVIRMSVAFEMYDAFILSSVRAGIIDHAAENSLVRGFGGSTSEMEVDGVENASEIR